MSSTTTDFRPLDTLAELTPEQQDDLTRAVAMWFVDHDTLDRDRLLTLAEEAKAVRR